MDLLIEWVKQIIVFILLASIIELIIPATAMKKYIKLVVGLILILIFLRPVFFLFDINIQQSLTESFSQLYEEETAEENMESLIKMQKKDIQASQDAYILEEMTDQLKNLAKDPLKEDYQAEINSIDFVFSDETEMAYENLEEVIVYLQEAEGGEGSVRAVEDVVINTDGPVQTEEPAPPRIEEAAVLLGDIWELDDKKVTIIWEGGAS